MTAETRREMFRACWWAIAKIAARRWLHARGCSETAQRLSQTREAQLAAQEKTKSRVEEISSGLRTTAQRSACTGKFKRELSHGICDLCRRCGEIPVVGGGDIGDRDAIERVALQVAAAPADELSAVVAGADVLTQTQACGGEERGNFVWKKAESPWLADLFERAQKFFGVGECGGMIEG